MIFAHFKFCPILAMLMARVHGHMKAYDAMQKGPKSIQMTFEWKLDWQGKVN
jgi:hypothetical protein